MSLNYIQIFDDTVIKMSVNLGLEDQRVSTTLGAFTMGELAFTRDSGRLFVGDNSDESKAHEKLQRTVGGILTGNKYLGKIDTRNSSIENEIGLDSKFKLKSDDFSASSIDDLTEENWIRWNRASHYNKKYDAMNGDILYDVNQNSLILFDDSVKGVNNGEKINIPAIGGFTKNGKLSYKTYQLIGNKKKCYIRTKLNDDNTRVAVDSEGKETNILVSTTASYCYYTGTLLNPEDDDNSSHWQPCDSNDQTLVIYVDEYEIPLKDQASAKEKTVAFNISDDLPQFGDGYVIFRNVIPDGTTIGFKNVEDYEVKVVDGVPTILSNSKSGRYTHNVLEVKNMPATRIMELMSDDFVENDNNKVSLNKNAVINQISTKSNALSVPNVIKFSSDLTGTSTRKDAKNGVTFNIKSEVNQTPVTSLNGLTIFVYGPQNGTVERVVFNEKFAKLHAGDGILLNGSKNVDVNVANTITLSVDTSTLEPDESERYVYDTSDKFYYPSTRRTDFYPGPSGDNVTYSQNLVIDKNNGKIIDSDKYYNNDYADVKNLFENENSSINYLKYPYSLIYTKSYITPVNDNTISLDVRFFVTPAGVAAYTHGTNSSDKVSTSNLYIKSNVTLKTNFLVFYPDISGEMPEVVTSQSYAYSQVPFISDEVDTKTGERVLRLGENEVLGNTLQSVIVIGPSVDYSLFNRTTTSQKYYITDFMSDGTRGLFFKNIVLYLNEEGENSTESRTLYRNVDKDVSYRRSNECLLCIDDVLNLNFEFTETDESNVNDVYYVNIRNVSVKAYSVMQLTKDRFRIGLDTPFSIRKNHEYDDIKAKMDVYGIVLLQAYYNGKYSTPILLSNGGRVSYKTTSIEGGAPAHARSVLLEVSRTGSGVYSTTDLVPLTISTTMDFSINRDELYDTILWSGPDGLLESTRNVWNAKSDTKILLSRCRLAGTFIDVIEVPILTNEYDQQMFNLSICGLRSMEEELLRDVLNIRYIGYRV